MSSKCAVAALALAVAIAGCSRSSTESEQVQETASDPSGTAGVGEPPAPRPAASPTAPPAVDPEGLATVHRYTDMFYGGQTDLLFENFTDEMREVLPLEQLSMLYEHAITQYGKQIRVIAEDLQIKDDYRGFVRWARFDKTEEVIEIQWILKADDKIAGFYIRPAPKKVRSEGTLEIQR